MARRNVSGIGVIGAIFGGGAMLLGLAVLAIFAAPVILIFAPVMVGWAIWDERQVEHDQAERARLGAGEPLAHHGEPAHSHAH